MGNPDRPDTALNSKMNSHSAIDFKNQPAREGQASPSLISALSIVTVNGDSLNANAPIDDLIKEFDGKEFDVKDFTECLKKVENMLIGQTVSGEASYASV